MIYSIPVSHQWQGYQLRPGSSLPNPSSCSGRCVTQALVQNSPKISDTAVFSPISMIFKAELQSLNVKDFFFLTLDIISVMWKSPLPHSCFILLLIHHFVCLNRFLSHQNSLGKPKFSGVKLKKVSCLWLEIKNWYKYTTMSSTYPLFAYFFLYFQVQTTLLCFSSPFAITRKYFRPVPAVTGITYSSNRWSQLSSQNCLLY